MKELHLKKLPEHDFKILSEMVAKERRRRRASGRIKKKAEQRAEKSAGKDILIIDTDTKSFKQNTSEMRAIPNVKMHLRSRYWQALIHQDWSHIYECSEDGGDYYVYAHIDPSKAHFCKTKEYGGDFGGEPFYIGKGVGNRAYDFKRNDGHGRYIRQLLKIGFSKDEIVHIAFSGLSETKAYEIESKLIYFFGTLYEKGRRGATLLNLATPIKPDYQLDMLAMKTEKSLSKNAMTEAMPVESSNA